MSSQNPNQDPRRPPRGKKGKGPPVVPNKIMHDEKEETRRVGGGRPPPNFGNMAIASPKMGNAGPTMMTAPVKAQVATQSQSVSKSIWGLSTVPTLPEFHPLERTAVFVPSTSPESLAGRIGNVLRDRSIQAHYDDSKAKVSCLTGEGVDFRIRLYRGRGQFSNGIIVEVQRRFGAGLNFHGDTKAILDAAEGKRPAAPPTTPSARFLPEVSDDEDDDYVPPPSGASALGMVSKMLQIPGFDGQYLGLQTLNTLVDPNRMTPKSARKVSAELLKADSEVGGKVFQYIVNRKTGDESYTELRNTALQILWNSIKSSSIVPEFLRSALRPVLLEDIKAAEKYQWAACCALGSMEYFIRGDEDTMELMEAFDIALASGEARHKNLMEVAQRCIAAIR